MQDFLSTIDGSFEGDIDTGEQTRLSYRHDASIFELTPKAVIYPKNSADIETLVRAVAQAKAARPTLSITPRAAGTDMSGAAIGSSLLLDMTRYFTTIKSVSHTLAHAQPGVLYRDLDPLLIKNAAEIGSVPASRAWCSVGGMVANNSGGERSLHHGNTENFVKKLKVVLSDGNEYTFAPIGKLALIKKMSQKNFEGHIYKTIFELVEAHYDYIKNSRPHVNKNSMGYNLWSVWDRENGIFDMTRLISGSQGTLGIITDITFRLNPRSAHSGLLVAFLPTLDNLGDIINTVLDHNPVTFEGFDDITFNLGIKYFADFKKQMGLSHYLRVQKSLLPEVLKFRGHLPQLVLMIEFEGQTQAEVSRKIKNMQNDLSSYNLETEIDKNEAESEKFWLIRRASFSLLRARVKDKYASPFIDDLTVPPKSLPEFLPQLRTIIRKYNLPATIAGHFGDGNFHVIPLMHIDRKAEQHKLRPAMEDVARIVLAYGGTLAGEHNDGMIRGPWLERVFGPDMLAHFKTVKHTFDPHNIFNPHKKTDANWEYSMRHVRSD